MALVGRARYNGRLVKPRAPSSSARSVSYAIWQLARTHRAYAQALLRELDLFPGQELLIMRLSDTGPQTQTELVTHMGVDHSTVAKSLARMEAAGLIARRASPDDRRATVVSLTAKGCAMRARIDVVWEQLERATVAALRPEERKQVVQLLARIEHSVAEAAVRS